MKRRAPGLALVVLLPLLAGCASSSLREADRLLQAGEVARAAEVYERILQARGGRPGRDRLLFRAAIANALATDGTDRPERGRELLGELVARYPGSGHRPAAELILALLEARLHHEDALLEARSRARELGLESDALRRQVDVLAGRLGSVEGELLDVHEMLARLAETIDRLQSEAASREQALRRLREQIDLLKAIDLDLERAPP